MPPMLPRRTLLLSALMLASLIAGCASSRAPSTPRESPAPVLYEDREPPGPSDAERFTLLAPGVASATRFATDSLPGYHVEVRDLLLGPIETAPDVPLDGFALMELSTGEIEISIDERKERREAGDLWFVRRGARIAIRNLGEIATIHTTVLRPK